MGQPLRVFGNLPYNISTPLMFHLFSYTDAIADMHFMLQKEVVNRLVAGPNSKAYGRLSVMAQYYCNVIPVLEVPPSPLHHHPKWIPPSCAWFLMQRCLTRLKMFVC